MQAITIMRMPYIFQINTNANRHPDNFKLSQFDLPNCRLSSFAHSDAFKGFVVSGRLDGFEGYSEIGELILIGIE